MSGEDSFKDMPLPALYQRGRVLLKQLDSQPAWEPSTQQLVEQVAAVWRAAAASADALALFSANEELEDLATADIKYLLIPFYQAEVLTHTHGADPSARLAALTSAGEQYKAFLHRCRQYSLLSTPALALADVVLQQGEGSGSSGSARTVDAATLRQNKIEKFMREKYVKGRLEALETQQRHQPGEGDAADGAEQQGDAEEAERELWMLQAELAALQAAEHVSTVQQEVQILRHATSMPEEQRQQKREQWQEAGSPPDLLRQLQAAAGSLGSAAGQRERLSAGVFRPSHVLPTMSVEQFGELEYRRMMEQQQWEAAAKERHERQQGERQADNLEEEELHKQRAMDEFKDDNPWGWGNSKLRPCS